MNAAQSTNDLSNLSNLFVEPAAPSLTLVTDGANEFATEMTRALGDQPPPTESLPFASISATPQPPTVTVTAAFVPVAAVVPATGQSQAATSTSVAGQVASGEVIINQTNEVGARILNELPKFDSSGQAHTDEHNPANNSSNWKPIPFPALAPIKPDSDVQDFEPASELISDAPVTSPSDSSDQIKLRSTNSRTASKQELTHPSFFENPAQRPASPRQSPIPWVNDRILHTSNEIPGESSPAAKANIDEAPVIAADDSIPQTIALFTRTVPVREKNPTLPAAITVEAVPLNEPSAAQSWRPLSANEPDGESLKLTDSGLHEAVSKEPSPNSPASPTLAKSPATRTGRVMTDRVDKKPIVSTPATVQTPQTKVLIATDNRSQSDHQVDTNEQAVNSATIPSAIPPVLAEPDDVPLPPKSEAAQGVKESDTTDEITLFEDASGTTDPAKEWNVVRSLPVNPRQSSHEASPFHRCQPMNVPVRIDRDEETEPLSDSTHSSINGVVHSPDNEPVEAEAPLISEAHKPRAQRADHSARHNSEMAQPLDALLMAGLIAPPVQANTISAPTTSTADSEPSFTPKTTTEATTSTDTGATASGTSPRPTEVNRTSDNPPVAISRATIVTAQNLAAKPSAKSTTATVSIPSVGNFTPTPETGNDTPKSDAPASVSSVSRSTNLPAAAESVDDSSPSALQPGLEIHAKDKSVGTNTSRPENIESGSIILNNQADHLLVTKHQQSTSQPLPSTPISHPTRSNTSSISGETINTGLGAVPSEPVQRGAKAADIQPANPVPSAAAETKPPASKAAPSSVALGEAVAKVLSEQAGNLPVARHEAAFGTPSAVDLKNGSGGVANVQPTNPSGDELAEPRHLQRRNHELNAVPDSSQQTGVSNQTRWIQRSSDIRLMPSLPETQSLSTENASTNFVTQTLSDQESSTLERSRSRFGTNSSKEKPAAIPTLDFSAAVKINSPKPAAEPLATITLSNDLDGNDESARNALNPLINKGDEGVGTPAAQTVEAMQNAAKRNEIAGQTEQNLPPVAQSTTAVVEEIAPRSPFRATRPAATTRKESAPSIQAALPTMRSGGIEPALTNRDVAEPALSSPDRLASTERLLSEISRQVVQLRRQDRDSMEVVLKPDANTELQLQLVQRNGIVEVDARFTRGDFQAMSSQWQSLQENLSQHGIRVNSLHEQHTASSSSFNQPGGGFNQRNGNSQRDQEPPSRWGEEFNLSGSVTKQLRHRRTRAAARNNQLETWA